MRAIHCSTASTAPRLAMSNQEPSQSRTHSSAACCAQTCRGRTTQGDALGRAQEIVDKTVALDIEVLAVTDHNNVDGIAGPSIRVSRPSGSHFSGFRVGFIRRASLFCASTRRTWTQANSVGTLGNLASAIRVLPLDWPPKPFRRFRRLFTVWGIAIAAHVTNDSGLFKVLTG